MSWPLYCRITSLGLVLALGTLLRFHSPLHGLGFHPDERAIVMVTERLSWQDLNPRFFAYGSFPIYLLWATSRLTAWVWPGLGGYDGTFTVARVLAALIGVATIGVSFLSALRLTATFSLAVVAAAAVALCPFLVQNSRFYTVDGPLTLLCLLSLHFLATAPTGNLAHRLRLAGIFAGLAIATKISGILLIPFLVLGAFRENGRFSSPRERGPWRMAAQSLALAVAVAVLVQPYAVLDWGTYWRHVAEQMSLVRGQWVAPYTLQYLLTTPYLYHLEQMAGFTLGPLAALVGWTAVGRSLWRARRSPFSAETLGGAWCAIFFLALGGSAVKFPRYLLPIYPPLLVLGAHFLAEISARAKLPAWSLGVLILVAPSLPRSLALAGVYSTPHVWTSASDWILDHAGPEARIAGEHWDDKLPLSRPGRTQAVRPWQKELIVFEPDSPEKWKQIAATLAEADFLTLPTARGYGPITRLPDRFPWGNRYYRLLFRGELGFRLERTFKEEPRFLGLRFPDESLDESLSVYDHPKVVIFRNAGRLAADEIFRRIEASLQSPPVSDGEREWILSARAGD